MFEEDRDEQLFEAVQQLNPLVINISGELIWIDTGVPLTEAEVETYLRYNQDEEEESIND